MGRVHDRDPRTPLPESRLLPRGSFFTGDPAPRVRGQESSVVTPPTPAPEAQPEKQVDSFFSVELRWSQVSQSRWVVSGESTRRREDSGVEKGVCVGPKGTVIGTIYSSRTTSVLSWVPIHTAGDGEAPCTPTPDHPRVSRGFV